MITLVAAMEQTGGIGLKGSMPWHMPEDLRQFKAYTMGKLVVLGYRTYISIQKGLPGRELLVLSRQKKQLNDARSVTSVEECIQIYKSRKKEMVIAGGGEIYRLFMPWADQMRLTTFHFTTQADTFFLNFDKLDWKKKECWKNQDMEILTWRKNLEMENREMEKIQLDHFAKARFLSCLQVSPDSLRSAWLTWQCQDEGYQGQIWMRDQDRIIQLTQGWESNFIWDDEETILFTSQNQTLNKSEKQQEELTYFYRLSVLGGERQEVFSLPCAVSQFYKLEKELYLIRAEIHKDYPDYATSTFEQRKEMADKIKKEEDYQVIEESPFVRDGDGFIDGIRDALFIFNEKSNTLKRITDDLFSTSFVSVHPSNSKLVFSGVTFQVLRPDEAGIYVFDWHQQELKCVLHEGLMRVTHVGWLDNQIVFCGSKRERYGICENSWLYQCNPSTQQITCLVESEENCEGSTLMQDCVYGSGKDWFVQNGCVRFVCTRGYEDELGWWDKQGLHFEKPLQGAIQCFDHVNNHLALLIGMDKQQLQELYSYDFDSHECKQLTHFNESVLKTCYVAKPQPLFFTSHQREIQGWILYPKDFKENQSYPGILDIHGGPKGAYGTTFFHEMQYWASEGYFVFYCNPFGSDGKGNEFADLRGKYGAVDYEDIMAFTDYVVAKTHQLDATRLGVTGGSYGGFMTNWIIGHTSRFAAAASQRSIANWISMIGTDESGFSFDTDQMAATPWTNPKKIWDQSPLQFANQATTPTLFIHSFEDYSCPIQEGWQMYHALVQHHVEARMCLFKKESHGLSRIGKRHHRLRRLQEITNWMNRFLKRV